VFLIKVIFVKILYLFSKAGAAKGLKGRTLVKPDTQRA